MEESLFEACRDGRHQEVERLLQQGANANYVVPELAHDSYQETPLIAASSFGHLRCVELLLGRGADPNKCSIEGWSPLHWSAYNGSAPVTRLLLGAGASAAITDGQKMT